MKHKTISPPQLPPVLSDIDEAAFTSDGTVEAARLFGALLTAPAKALSLDEVHMERVIASGVNFERMTARDLIAKSCDFSACRAWEASLLRSTLTDCRMTGWDSNRGICKDVTFVRCKLDIANFRFAKLTRVTFIDCILTNADFLSAQLQNVTFEKCHLEATEFAQCSMKDVDFRGSDLINIRGWQYFKGATIDTTQLMGAAPHLAQEIGIIVE